MLVYLTDPTFTPNWIKADATLQDVFSKKQELIGSGPLDDPENAGYETSAARSWTG